VPFGQRGEILDEQLEVWAKAWRGSPVMHGGKHYSFGDIWMEPQPARTGGPPLWFGGSSLHPRLIARLVRYGSGFNPLGPAGNLAPLEAAMRAAGRDPGELEYVGGTCGEFPGPDAVADLDQALAAVPAQVARGFGTICVKPSQFLDETAGIGAFCRSLAEKAAALPA
jgi:alkanesulfonate monooxygenase SsuD/methylene tetrahydromethanopterin reductase-like flavin-dependent oxidoreductase (luciferase family)